MCIAHNAQLLPDVAYPLYSLSLLYFLDLKPKKFQILTVSLTGEYFTKCFFAAFRAALKAFGYFWYTGTKALTPPTVAAGTVT